jgi:Dyp-type peroxidase family
MPGILSAESLPNIQGNILTPFTKNRFLYLFARFGDAQRAHHWLAEIVADPALASAQRMLDEPTRPTWLAIGFTSSGLGTLHPELAPGLEVFTAFQQGPGSRVYLDGGPAASAALVGDPEAGDPARWVVGNPERPPVDVMLTIAADDDVLLAKAAQAEQVRAAEHGLDLLTLEQGDGTTTAGQRAGRLDGKIDHFGFRDGISQPGVRGFTPEVIRHRRLEVAGQPGSPVIAAGEFILGYDAEPRFYPVPGAGRPTPPPWMHDGSFQVLLRLNQDVHGWRSRAARLRSTVAATVDVAESAIGRTTDGRPLAPVGRGGYGGHNDFTYAGDPDGATTPLSAHIRRMNPRNDDVSHDRQHRLLRRGTSFGPFLPEGETDDGVERGMMFNAFMASIEDQFEYVQRRWANPFTTSSTGTSAASVGSDALIGAGASVRLAQRDGEAVDVLFPPLVHTSGAVYAFAPSVWALGKLASAEPISVGQL